VAEVAYGFQGSGSLVAVKGAHVLADDLGIVMRKAAQPYARSRTEHKWINERDASLQ